MKKYIMLAILIIAIIIALLCWRENRTYHGPIQKVNATAQQIEHGRYLAQAGDCSACHTATSGPFAGGTPLETPFGTIYGSNITPSADYGIGRWSKEDFFLALTKGIAPGGKHLYPAMPYTSYKGISRQDSDDLYAYLMTRRAIDISPPKNQLPFPFNQRALLIGWNMLFYRATPLPASSQGSSPEWQRGRYLADVLGHCGECHTPRGKFGQMDLNKTLQGGSLSRFIAPDITPNALAQRGWSTNSLLSFLSTGIAPQGSAFGDMYPVITLSTRHLTPADQKALVSYLVGDKPALTQQVRQGQGSNAGHMLYLNLCSGCHASQGEGKPHVAVSLRENSTLRQPDSINLITSILDGLPEQRFTHQENMQEMPGFANQLTNEELAELVNYLRVTWGGLPANITGEHVQKLRKNQ